MSGIDSHCYIKRKKKKQPSMVIQEQIRKQQSINIYSIIIIIKLWRPVHNLQAARRTHCPKEALTPSDHWPCTTYCMLCNTRSCSASHAGLCCSERSSEKPATNKLLRHQLTKQRCRTTETDPHIPLLATRKKEWKSVNSETGKMVRPWWCTLHTAGVS